MSGLDLLGDKIQIKDDCAYVEEGTWHNTLYNVLSHLRRSCVAVLVVRLNLLFGMSEESHRRLCNE